MSTEAEVLNIWWLMLRTEIHLIFDWQKEDHYHYFVVKTDIITKKRTPTPFKQILTECLQVASIKILLFLLVLKKKKKKSLD